MADWSLANRGADAGQMFMRGMQQGEQARVQKETRNALSALLKNPDDPMIAQNLGRFNPEAALQIQGQQQQRATGAQQADITRRAVMGDAGAQGELAAFNPDLYRDLSKEQRAQATKGMETLGQLALMADTPEEWEDMVGQLSSVDPQFSKYRGQFGMRDAYIAQAGQVLEALKQAEPRYQVIPEGGALVNTRDPAAISQYQQSAAPISGSPNSVGEADASAIIQRALQSKTITPQEMQQLAATLGPNGQRAAQDFMTQNGIRVAQQSAPPPPPGFQID